MKKLKSDSSVPSISIKWARFAARFACSALLFGGAASGARAGEPLYKETVFLTHAEALKAVFPKADRVAERRVTLTKIQIQRIQKRLGWKVKEKTIVIYDGFILGRLDGFAVESEEIGKREPITFIVKTTPDLKVERVEVMVYREPHGMEVQKRPFLAQFDGKTAAARLSPGKDVVNITGASLSVQAMAAGVKRMLCILDEVQNGPKS